MKSNAHPELPALRDAGEPLLEAGQAADYLGTTNTSVIALAETGKLFGFGRNASARPGKEQRTRWMFPKRSLRLYEARTANFASQDVAELLLDIGKRLSPEQRLWLTNELRRTLGGQ